MSKIRRDLPNNQYQAAVGANNPSGTNVFATMADLPVVTGDANRIVFDVKINQAGGINKGQAVYVNGASGTNILVGKADYSTEATSSKTLGLLISSGANNDQRQVIAEGLLKGTGAAPLDTSAGAAGDPVWLGDDGNLIYGLINKPYAPNHLVFIGIVVESNSTVGEIFVKIQNGFELDELHDVDLISNPPTDGQVLTYDNGTGLWINEDLPAVIGETLNVNLSPVLDNTISDPSTIIEPNYDDSYLVPAGAVGVWAGQDNNIATWDGEQWLFYTPSSGDSTTVLTGPNAGYVYTFDGLVWNITLTTSPGATPFFIAGSAVDAGGNKTSTIARVGPVTLGSNSGAYGSSPLTVRGTGSLENVVARWGMGAGNAITLNNWFRIATFTVNNNTSKTYKILFSVTTRNGEWANCELDVNIQKTTGVGRGTCRVINHSGSASLFVAGIYQIDETNFEFRRFANAAAGSVTFRLYYKPTILNSSVSTTVLNAIGGTTNAIGIQWTNTYIGAAIEPPATGGNVQNYATYSYEGQRDNIIAVVDPTVNDDNLAQYSYGSQWYNTVTKEVFQCLDNTTGAAVWKQITNEIPFIPPLEQSEIRRGVIAISSSTATGAIGGITPALTGSAVAISFGGTVPLPKLRLLTTTGTSNSTVGIITGSSNVIYRIGRGFRFIGSYIYSDQSAGGTNWFVPGALQFCGLVSGISLLNISSTNTVETRTNLIGMGSDSTDTNLQIFHNDASGNCTKLDLGPDFPANKTGAVANGEAYQLELYNEFGSTDVKYRVRRLSDGVEVTGTINSNIPSGATDLGPQIVRSSGSTSQNVSIDIIQLTAYTRE